jgi:hypothetical protein
MAIQIPEHLDRDDAREWQLFIWNLPNDAFSEPQKLQLMLILQTRFNLFEPFPVVKDLIENRELWLGVVMDRGVLLPREQCRVTSLRTDLIKLRDVASPFWNVNTLFILTLADSVSVVERMARKWDPSELTILSGHDTDNLLGIGRGQHPLQIVAPWWD